MRVSIPGLPGVYYDTEADSTAVTAVFTAAGRRAPKPQGYAVQALPVLWSLDVDLREVPADHPLQYLHPEGAHSLEELSDRRVAGVGRDLDFGLRFLAAVNDRTEESVMRLVGRDESVEGTVIEIEGDEREEREDRIERDRTDDAPSSGDDRAAVSGEERVDAGHADEPTFADDGAESVADSPGDGTGNDDEDDADTDSAR